jgi:hypothetical protein
MDPMEDVADAMERCEITTDDEVEAFLRANADLYKRATYDLCLGCIPESETIGDPRRWRAFASITGVQILSDREESQHGEVAQWDHMGFMERESYNDPSCGFGSGFDSDMEEEHKPCPHCPGGERERQRMRDDRMVLAYFLRRILAYNDDAIKC